MRCALNDDETSSLRASGRREERAGELSPLSISPIDRKREREREINSSSESDAKYAQTARLSYRSANLVDGIRRALVAEEEDEEDEEGGWTQAGEDESERASEQASETDLSVSGPLREDCTGAVRASE